MNQKMSTDVAHFETRTPKQLESAEAFWKARQEEANRKLSAISKARKRINRQKQGEP